jgi:hypothetical protein
MEEVNKTLQDLVNRVTTVSEEMGNFRKQMEDYRADLDGIKRKLVEGERASVLPRLDARPSKGGLTNNGLPLLDTPQTSAAGAAAGAAAPFHTAPGSPTNQEEIRVRAPRHDFPKFHGVSPLLWVDQCFTYFEMFHIPHAQWVSMIRPKCICFPEHFCYCFSSNLCVLNTTNTD